MVGRLLLLSAVTIHRLLQILSAKEDLDYHSLYHFRHASNERCSFGELIDRMANLLATRKIVESTGSANQVLDILQNEAIVDHRRNCSRLQKTKVTGMQIGSVITSMTPMKKVLKFYDSSEGSLKYEQVLNRRKDCTGMPVYCVHYDPVKKEASTKGKGAQARCARCGKVTNSFCLGCHHWLCGPHLARSLDMDFNQGKKTTIDKTSKCKGNTVNSVVKIERPSVNLNEGINSEVLYCMFSCWIDWHKEGLRQHWKGSIDDFCVDNRRRIGTILTNILGQDGSAESESE